VLARVGRSVSERVSAWMSRKAEEELV